MSILGNLAAAAIKTALLPIAVAIDVVTLGGALTDDNEMLDIARKVSGQ